jgi:hypothetical protein
MKQKTNIQVKNNLGYHINANMEVADSGSHESGMLMDANAIEKMIDAKIAALINGAGTNSDTLKELSDAIPTKVSQLNNDSGFITNSAISSFITEQALYNYLVEHQLLQAEEEPVE